MKKDEERKVEKQYKPVPDVECLKYHGTDEKPDIKIFVSHRIDLDSEIIDNPLYIPVRCGAIYDDREDVDMLGDDTGDNISDKRMRFCELTVMYWAWKNVKADYYGLCHYRRYLSFNRESFLNKNLKLDSSTDEAYLSTNCIDKYSLDDEKFMQQMIPKYDVLTSVPEDVTKAADGPFKSVMELCERRPCDFDVNAIYELIKIVKQDYPQYYADTVRYFKGTGAKFYNCFVLKEKIFDSLCTFVFDVLFKLEKKIDFTNLSTSMTRMPAYFSEALIGAFLLSHEEEYSIKYLELIRFGNTNIQNPLKPFRGHNNVPIVFASSGGFAPYAIVFIKSVLNYVSSDNNYDFIVLESNISDFWKNQISHLISGYSNVSIRFCDPKPLIEGLKLHISASYLTIETFYRVLAPYILPYYDKAIVMDCDIIAKCDIAELFYMNLDGHIAGAALDAVWHAFYNGVSPDMSDYIKESFPIKHPYEYVNTGVLLLNLEKFRNTYSQKYILNYISTHKFRIQEQDALNILLEGKVKFIDISWNMYAKVSPFISDCIDKWAPVWMKERYDIAHERPKLIHWAATPKPWDYPDIDYGEEWWLVARQTNIYETLIARLAQTQTRFVLSYPGVTPQSPYCSKVRKLADNLIPIGTKRRAIAKRVLPKGTRRWKLCKKIYYSIFKG